MVATAKQESHDGYWMLAWRQPWPGGGGATVAWEVRAFHAARDAQVASLYLPVLVEGVGLTGIVRYEPNGDVEVKAWMHGGDASGLPTTHDEIPDADGLLAAIQHAAGVLIVAGAKKGK